MTAFFRTISAVATGLCALCASPTALAKPAPRVATKDFQAGSVVSNPQSDSVAYVDDAGRIAVRNESGRLERTYNSPADCRPVAITADVIGLDCGLRLLLRSSGEVVDLNPNIPGVSDYDLLEVGTRWVAALAYSDGEDVAHGNTQEILVNRASKQIVNLAQDAGGNRKAVTLNRSTPYRALCRGLRRHAVGAQAPPFLPALYLGRALFELNAEPVRSKSRITTCSGEKRRYISGTSHRFSVFNGGFFVEGANDVHRRSTILQRVNDRRRWTFKDSSVGGASGGSSAVLSRKVLWIENGNALYRISLPNK